MNTDLPLGTLVRYRYHGEWEYAEVVECNAEKLLRLSDAPPTGTMVHTCVWKGDRLESRRVSSIRVAPAPQAPPSLPTEAEVDMMAAQVKRRLGWDWDE